MEDLLKKKAEKDTGEDLMKLKIVGTAFEDDIIDGKVKKKQLVPAWKQEVRLSSCQRFVVAFLT
jgi:hypothetical protein